MSDSPAHTGSAYVADVLRTAGIVVTAQQSEQLEAHAAMLLEWNAKVNLISRKDVEHVWRNHILHSLAALAIAHLPDGGIVLDLGTGGGLPGLPLAIMLPRARFVLCDSIVKKIAAVRAMADALGLPHTECIVARAEDLSRDPARAASFDVVLARAVTRLPDLVRWSRPLLKRRPDARLIAWKGGDVAAEVSEALRIAGVDSINVEGFDSIAEPYFVAQDKKIITVEFRST
jgi:16S rRNA (guanine527-N7)-methyltransferase